MEERKEVKQKNRIRISYAQLTGEEKKVYWENFKRMAKVTPTDDEIPSKIDHCKVFIEEPIDM